MERENNHFLFDKHRLIKYYIVVFQVVAMDVTADDNHRRHIEQECGSIVAN